MSDELDDNHINTQSSKFPFSLYLTENNPQHPSQSSKFTDNTMFDSLVGKLKEFIPKIANSNSELPTVPSKTLDIEDVSDQDRFVEMNIQLFELDSEQSSDDEDTPDDNMSKKLECGAKTNNPLIIEETLKELNN